jgi:cysteinyl-tRNA synthetase
MHGEFLTIDGGKMSKSLGNIYTIQDLIDRKFDPLAYRYFVLQAHYRTKLNFTFEALLAAQNALHRLYDLVQSWQEPSEISPEYEKRFKQALDDDLSMPKILALIWELVADISLPLSMKSKTLLAFDEVLGLGLEDYIAKPLEIPEELQNLINEREKARQAKDYKLADLLRIQITQKGFILEDTDQGQKLRKGSFRQM